MNSVEEKYLAFTNSIKNRFNTLRKRNSFRYGLPFILLVVVGSFGLREFSKVRYLVSNVKGVSREEAKKMGLIKEKEVSLETTFEEIQTLDIDNWENKRGPRPWEMPEKQKK